MVSCQWVTAVSSALILPPVSRSLAEAEGSTCAEDAILPCGAIARASWITAPPFNRLASNRPKKVPGTRDATPRIADGNARVRHENTAHRRDTADDDAVPERRRDRF